MDASAESADLLVVSGTHDRLRDRLLGRARDGIVGHRDAALVTVFGAHQPGRLQQTLESRLF